jgi:hypothetical protein
MNNNGNQWNWNSVTSVFGYPWNFTNPPGNPCSPTNPWQGVTCSTTCTSQPCNILKLELENMNLKGSLPLETLSSLSQLTVFNADHNKLTGSIPSILSMNNFTALEVLSLANNRLTGPVPALLGDLLPALRFLFLQSKSTHIG